jgi:hypothetical protein
VGAAAGVLAGSAAGGGREAAGGVVAVAAAAGAGLVDDLRGGAQAKGLKGHRRALAHGQVTTGAVKIAVIGLGALAGAVVGAAGARGGGSRGAAVGRVLVDGALTAGTANLVNLLDLRPGRALKAVLTAAGPLVAGGGPGVAVAAAAAGAGAASLPSDLGERTMLGDTGANALGAAVGYAAGRRLGPVGRLVALGAVVAATLASERVSFSAVIAGNPLLRRLDALGQVGGASGAPPTPSVMRNGSQEAGLGAISHDAREGLGGVSESGT